MRRKLSLLLAVVMILGSFSFAFADEGVDVPAFLKENGILVGNESGDLMLDDYLLRKDAVVLLARLLDKEDEAENFEMEGYPTFTDLAGNPYYNAFLAWAEYNGYFNGRPDGSFGYNDNLEAVEYALVLLRALEYGEDDKAEEWAKAWDLAEELGLLENVEIERRELITRRDVAQMTFNALGVEMKEEGITLAEFLGIELPEEPKPEKLEVVDVYTENLAEVVVELSNAELVKNKDALLNPANYRLGEEIKVYNVDLDGDNVVLTLVPYGRVDEQGKVRTLVKGRNYKLTIRNIDPKINKTYSFTARDVAVPTVENVEFIGTYGIKVTTSEPVNNPQERNFKVDGKRVSMVIEQYGRVLILTPYHDRTFDEDATELVVEGLEDFAGYRSALTVEEMELSTDNATPVVEKAYRSGDKLTLVFDRDIYRKSVSPYRNRRNTGNVSFVERRVTFYADEAEKVDTNVAVYKFEREIPKDAVITVEGVQNHFKEAMEPQEVETILYVDDYAPVIISDLTANVVSTDEQVRGEVTQSTEGLKIVFDKDIREFVDALEEVKDLDDEDKIKDELNKVIDIDKFVEVYRLEVSRKGRNDANDVEVVIEEVESDSITISFKNIYVNNSYRDYDYVLEVQDFTDLNRNRMEREYIDFQVVPKGVAFDVVGGIEIEEVGYDVEVRIRFNDYVDKDEAENPKNYYFGKDGKDLIVDEAIVERDGKTVSLLIRDTTIAKVQEKEILEISPRVTNIDGDRIDGSRFFDLKTGTRIKVEPDIPEGPKAKIIDQVTGNAPVKAETAKITIDGITLETVEAKAFSEGELVVKVDGDTTSTTEGREASLNLDQTEDGVVITIKLGLTSDGNAVIPLTAKELRTLLEKPENEEIAELIKVKEDVKDNAAIYNDYPDGVDFGKGEYNGVDEVNQVLTIKFEEIPAELKTIDKEIKVNGLTAVVKDVDTATGIVEIEVLNGEGVEHGDKLESIEVDGKDINFEFDSTVDDTISISQN